jgi:putative transcriptional regulator
MITPVSGTLLIADPFLRDPNFMRTVVFLCEHQDEGSFGFVLNRPMKVTLGELLPELEGNTTAVFYGGPVQMDTIHFLHQLPDCIPGGFEVAEGVYWGGDFALMVDLMKQQQLDLKKVRFYLGYSGWGGGQLANEMKEKSWLTVKARKGLVFHKNYGEIWKDSLIELGGEYEQMVNYPTDPQLN